MSSDPGQREPRGRRPDLRLPALVGIDIRRVRFERPTRRNFTSDLSPRDTVELLVETDGPIPVRALSPVLYVGRTPVTEVSADDDTHYRFVALRPDELEDGAPVSLSWSGQPPADTQDTAFRFERPGNDSERPGPTSP